MGTRSLTRVLDGDGRVLLCIYRQFDGYPTGMGADLKGFLSPIRLINGIQGQKAGEAANGMGCLAAQLVAHLKDGKIGNVYVEPPDAKGCGEEYAYTIRPDGGDGLLIRCATTDWDKGDEKAVLYDGPLASFDPEAIEKATA